MAHLSARRFSRWCLVSLLAVACAATAAEKEAKKKPPPLPELPGTGWKPIFDGSTMKGWKIEEEGELAMHGEIGVKKGSLHLPAGMPFSAVKCAEKIPTNNYEVALDAKRVSGFDIFCGITFPVDKAHVTLVLGGWGDTVVGLSNVDGQNASDNETMRNIGFDNDRWYRVRVRVSDTKIEVWIDEKKLIDLKRIGRKFDLYPQLEALRPFGIFSWRSEALLANIKVRPLEAAPLPPLPGKGWKPMLNGKNLDGWKVVAEGEDDEKNKARALDGVILCEQGVEITGIKTEMAFPTMDYEVAVDAMRVEGDDFFCAMTFPYGKMAATFVVGGWGGSVVGISNVDGLNASENDTTQDITFAKQRWYRIRLRVTKQKIQAWIDKDKVIDLDTKDKKLAAWLQQEAYLPFGINAWQTKAALRNIMLRKLGGDVKKAGAKK
ncbi:DUF1080 domain-containing protein [bacterium]|nr:DUF1080 domain-containing protein [bacterium]